MTNNDVLKFTSDSQSQGKKVALVTVTEVKGSTPASVGQMIAILANGDSYGTVGGGAAEFAIKQRSIQAMESDEAFFKFSFALQEQGMVCGGSMSGFGTVFGVGQHLVIFGGGLIAQELATIAARAGFDITVVEDRPEMEVFFSDAKTGAKFILVKPEDYTQKITLNRNSYVVITTYSHKMDQAALGFCADKELAYLGMIGSKKKVETIKGALGLPEEKNIYAPIGLDIASLLPGEIAVSIVAEMLLIKNNGVLRHKKL